MKKMSIFEQAMCCATGVCGPSVDPDLLRVSTVINNLAGNGVFVDRYTLSSNPQAFLDNKSVNEIISKDGVDSLPITVINGEVIKIKAYPTNDEFINLLEVPAELISSDKPRNQSGCCSGGGCC